MKIRAKVTVIRGDKSEVIAISEGHYKHAFDFTLECIREYVLYPASPIEGINYSIRWDLEELTPGT